MLKKISLLIATITSAFALHTAELNINDIDLEVNARSDMGQSNPNVEPNTMFIGGRFFTPDKSHSRSSLTDINPYFEVNFLIMREVGSSGMNLGFGTKLNYSKLGSKEFSALPLGLEFKYMIPAKDLVPMSVNVSVYYAPQVLSFANAKNYYDYRIHYDVEFIKNVNAAVGLRSMNTTFKDSSTNINYNESFYFGVKVGF